MLTLLQEFPLAFAGACSLLAIGVTAAACRALYRHRIQRLVQQLTQARGAAATAQELYAQARRQSDQLYERLRVQGGAAGRSANASGWLELPEVTPLDGGLSGDEAPVQAQPPRRLRA